MVVGMDHLPAESEISSCLLSTQLTIGIVDIYQVSETDVECAQPRVTTLLSCDSLQCV